MGGASTKNSLAAKKTEEIARMRAAMTPEQEFIKMLAERGVMMSVIDKRHKSAFYILVATCIILQGNY